MSASQLERLLEVSALLTSTLDLGALLTKVLQTAEDLMEAAASNVMLLDRSRNELVYEVALGQASSQIREQKRLKVGVGIAGWVAEHGEPLLIPDAYKDPRFFSDFDKKTGFKTKSILCIPLRIKGGILGVAQIINKKSADSFSSDDLTLFSRFCDIAAVAIDNALLHRQIIEQDRFKRDLILAEEIQRASLPPWTPAVGLLKTEFRSMACRQVGGDVLEIAPLADGRLAILLADVSGKGVPAALFGAKLSSEFHYELKSGVEGGKLLARLNDAVAKRSTRGIFVTAIYAVFEPSTGWVEFVNAGHLKPYVVGPEKGRCVEVASPGFPPLGVVPELEYQATRFQLPPGAQWVMTTDGVTEAKAVDGSRLGDAATHDALGSNPGNAIARLMAVLRQFTQGEIPADDVTVVGVRFGNYKEFTITSDPSELAKVRTIFEELTASIGYSEKISGRITLAVTEALANVMRHTYKMDLTGKICVGIGQTRSELQISIRDWGPKQNSALFASRDLEDIRPGGLGIHYMKQVMSMVEFDDSHVEGNELYMSIDLPLAEGVR